MGHTQFAQHTEECMIEGNILGDLLPSQSCLLVPCLTCVVKKQLDVPVMLGLVQHILSLHLCYYTPEVWFVVAPLLLA